MLMATSYKGRPFVLLGQAAAVGDVLSENDDSWGDLNSVRACCAALRPAPLALTVTPDRPPRAWGRRAPPGIP